VFAYVEAEALAAEQLGALRAAYRQEAVQAGLPPAEAEARAEAAVRGKLALAYVNPVLAQAGQPQVSPAGLPRGIGYVHMGKSALFASVGARYAVVKDTFEVYAAWRMRVTGGEAQQVLGEAQAAWLAEAAGSSHTWKVVVSSVSPTAMVWDLRKPDVEPPTVRNRYYFNADQWDGFPDSRRQVLEALRDRTGGRALVVAGDIHAAFASVEYGVAAVTAPAISSRVSQEAAAEAVTAAGFPPGTAVYRYAVEQQEAMFREGNPGIAFVDTRSHGFTVVEVGEEEVRAAYHLIGEEAVRESFAERPEELAARFSRRAFRIRPGRITPE
jgi:alkaline phosphatase D